MDLSYLQVLEREKVLEVLRRDKQLRAVEEDRIRWVISALVEKCWVMLRGVIAGATIIWKTEEKWKYQLRQKFPVSFDLWRNYVFLDETPQKPDLTFSPCRRRRMKCELQDLRRRGAKNFARQYGERTCARCQRPLGKFWNSGAVCCGCSHRICRRCRVGAENWKCTVCHAYR